MNIYISDMGIYTSPSSKVFSGSASIERIKEIKQTDSNTDSVMREAQKAYVAENTPAYNISISSAGRAAVASLNRFTEGFEKLNSISKNNEFISSAASDSDSYKTSVYDTAVDFEKSSSVYDYENSSEDEGITFEDNYVDKIYEPEKPVGITEQEEEPATAKINSNSLGKYTESQLQKLVSEGSISRSDMNGELDKRTASKDSINVEAAASAVSPIVTQAMAAYNYQMSFRVNAVSV